MFPITQAAGAQKIPVTLFDSSHAEVTGITAPTITISKNGGAFASPSDGTWAELGGGVYTVALDATDRSTVGWLLLRVTHASALDARVLCYVTDNQVDLVDAPNATAVTAIQSGLATAAGVSAVESDTQDIQTQIGTAGAGLTAIGDTRLAELEAGNLPADIDAIKADVAGLDGAAMRGTDGAYTGTPPTAAAIADAVLDEAVSGHSTAGTVGKTLADLLEDTGTTIPGLIAALNDLSAAEVNAEVVDALATDTIAELTADPGATPTHRQIVALLYMWLRNANTATATARTIKNNAGTTVLTATTSDDGTTFTQGKLG